jgi:hypothetical protein
MRTIRADRLKPTRDPQARSYITTGLEAARRYADWQRISIALCASPHLDEATMLQNGF